MTGSRWPANLATLGNGLVGVGSIAYTLAGNPLWAMLLIAAGIGFDGVDGFLARRAGLGPSRFGRVADSVSDAVTFGLAPGVLIAFHTEHASAWAPWTTAAFAVAALVASLAIARLVYFTLRGFHHPDFVGVPTPQNALAVVLLILFLDVPGFLAIHPPLLLGLEAVLAVLMVAPIPFPKIRRGHRLRYPLTLAGVALVVAIVPLQFQTGPGTPLYFLGEVAAIPAAVGVAIYYVVGPFTVPKEAPTDG